MKKKYIVASQLNWKCAYCGEDLTDKELCLDHVIPRCKGGSNKPSNLLPSCRKCNSQKGVKSLEEYRLYSSFKEVVKEPHFSQNQINFLKENGLLKQLGVTKMIKFFFETVEVK